MSKEYDYCEVCGRSDRELDELNELKNQLNIERIGHRDQIRKLEAELAAERIASVDEGGCAGWGA